MLQQFLQKLLIVAQCDFDYQRISFVLSKIYGVEFHRTDSFNDAIQKALSQ
jgi:hypothetical protein